MDSLDRWSTAGVMVGPGRCHGVMATQRNATQRNLETFTRREESGARVFNGICCRKKTMVQVSPYWFRWGYPVYWVVSDGTSFLNIPEGNWMRTEGHPKNDLGNLPWLRKTEMGALSKWKPTRLDGFPSNLRGFISGRFLAGKASAKGLGTSFRWSNDGQMVVFPQIFWAGLLRWSLMIDIYWYDCEAWDLVAMNLNEDF